VSKIYMMVVNNYRFDSIGKNMV